MAAVPTTQLRADFPEFSSKQKFPDSSCAFWLNIAFLQIRANVWGQLYVLAQELWTAHMLVLEEKAQLEAALGNLPGVSTGAVTSQSVDKVSEAYDTSGSAEEKAGHWNLTIFGTRFIRLAKMAGMGGIQLSGGVPVNGSYVGGQGGFPWIW